MGRLLARHRAGHPSADDGGFTLLEAVMAMAVFSVLATVALGSIVQSARVSGSNVRRTAATNLAMRQIESVRSMPAQSIPDGRQVTTQIVGGITYTIAQTAQYSAGGTTTNLCTSGSSLAYKVVTVTVTWANMGTVKPVRADTMRAVGVGAGALDQSTLGTLAVLVSGATGAPQSGVTVTLSSGAGQVSGDDGCVVFAGLSPGNYTASAAMDGWSGVTNTRTATSSTLGVTAATVSRGSLVYDTSRAVEIQLGVDPSVAAMAAPAGGLVTQMGSSYVPDRTYPACSGTVTDACTAGTPGLVQGLFPETYTITAGRCTNSASRTTIDLRPVASTPPVATVPMGAITVGVVTSGGTPLAGRQITITSTVSGCSDSYSVTSVAVGSTVAVPYGSWTVTTSGTGGSDITLSTATRTATVALVVSA